jgi:hypothetical protein
MSDEIEWTPVTVGKKNRVKPVFDRQAHVAVDSSLLLYSTDPESVDSKIAGPALLLNKLPALNTEVQIVYPPQIKSVNSITRGMIETISYPDKNYNSSVSCSVMQINATHSYSLANSMLEFNSINSFRNKVVVLDYNDQLCLTDLDLRWIRGVDFTPSLVPDLCILVKFPLPNGISSYNLCLRDSADALSTKAAMNRDVKRRLRANNDSESLEFLKKLIKKRESGTIDEILKAPIPLRDLIERLRNEAVLKAPTVRDVTEVQVQELMKEYQVFQNTYYRGLLLHTKLGNARKFIINQQDRVVDNNRESLWMRAEHCIGDFALGKSYNPQENENIHVLSSISVTTFYDKLIKTALQRKRILQFNDSATAKHGRYVLTNKYTPPGYAKCDMNKRPIIRIIFVLLLDFKIVISGEKYYHNRFDEASVPLKRLSHSQLAEGEPVRAAGELVLEQNLTDHRWKFVEINNRSGHYAPPADMEIFNVVEKNLIDHLEDFVDGRKIRKINTMAFGMPGRS